MAMVKNKAINFLNDLKPYKNTWKVEVKVLRSWTQHSKHYGEEFGFILEDKMGCVIHCTCKSIFLARVRKLQLGQWRYLENFSVVSAVGISRPTSHKFKIVITGNSIVTKSTVNTCEVPLVDHNKESSSENDSTPFSKRKEGDADLKDMNSTSKKLCAKNIIMEKTKED